MNVFPAMKRVQRLRANRERLSRQLCHRPRDEVLAQDGDANTPRCPALLLDIFCDPKMPRAKTSAF